MRNTEALQIAYLVQQFPPEVGAGPARVSEMGARWLDAGAAVTVITGMPNRPEGKIHAPYRGKIFESERWNGMEVHRSWLYASPRHGFARTLANNLSFMASSTVNVTLRMERPDILIASSPPFFVHLAGEVARRRWRVPLVLELRDLWPDYLVGMDMIRGKLSQRALFGLERALLTRAAHVVVVTESFRSRVIQKGVAPERVTVIPNGVETEFYRREISEPAPLPELRRRGDEVIVGYLGNFGAAQGLPAVIEAARLLQGESPRIRFVLVGDGTDRAEVLRHAQRTGAANVSIHPPIPKRETRAFYNACDVCVVPLADFPVLQETIPSKIFEAMACETPVVASLAGEGEAVIHRSRAGLTARPGDPASIAAAVKYLAERPPAERAEIGRRGREFVVANFSRDVLARRYLDVLSQLTKRSGFGAAEHLPDPEGVRAAASPGSS